MKSLSFWTERRRELRFSYSTLIHYRIKERENIWNYAHSMDVSPNGMRLVINRRIEPSDPLILKLVIPGASESIELRCVAVWKRSLDGRVGMECGIVFDDATCQEHLEQFRLFIMGKFCGGEKLITAPGAR